MHYRYFGKPMHAAAVLKADFARVQASKPERYKQSAEESAAAVMPKRDRNTFCRKRI